MQILKRPVSREELKAIAQNTFGEMVKCVADSLINIRSWQNNPSRDILNPEVRDSIKAIVAKQIIG